MGANLYNIVTNDEYEIPVRCDLNVNEAAEFFGTNANNLRKMVIRPPKKTLYKVVVSGKVEHDSKEYMKLYGHSESGGKGTADYARQYQIEWDEAVERLRSSRADLGKIRITGLEKTRY